MQNNYFKNNLGFTVLELMITVAIIGILASLAISSYNKYINKAKVTEAFQIAQPLKLRFAECFEEFGDVKNCNIPPSPQQGKYGAMMVDYSSAIYYTFGADPVYINDTKYILLPRSKERMDAAGKLTYGTIGFYPSVANGKLEWICKISPNSGQVPDRVF